jgi:hypothetical protein
VCRTIFDELNDSSIVKTGHLARQQRPLLDGDDLRRDPLAVRKATLASAAPGLHSTSTSMRRTARLSSSMPASLASKA